MVGGGEGGYKVALQGIEGGVVLGAARIWSGDMSMHGGLSGCHCSCLAEP